MGRGLATTRTPLWERPYLCCVLKDDSGRTRMCLSGFAWRIITRGGRLERRSVAYSGGLSFRGKVMVQYKRALPVGFAIVLAISCIVAWFVGYQRELERQRHEVNTAAAITIEACLPSIETLRFGEFTQCLVEVFQADPDALRENFDLKAQQIWPFGPSACFSCRWLASLLQQSVPFTSRRR